MSIDRLVVTRCLGWTESMETSPRRWCVPLDSPYFREYDSTLSKYDPPHFSSSMADAWNVVEHLRKQLKEDGSRKYLVSIIDDIGYPCVQIERVMERFYQAQGPCEAKAICICALRAVGVSEAEIQEACK